MSTPAGAPDLGGIAEQRPIALNAPVSRGTRIFVSHRTTVSQIAESLGETAPRPLSQIAQIVSAVGEVAALGLLARTEQVELSGGLRLPDGPRRTPGGVFFQLARSRLPPEQLRAIFAPESRAIDTQASPQRTTVFGAVTIVHSPVVTGTDVNSADVGGQRLVRLPRRDRTAPATGAVAPKSNALPITSHVTASDTGQKSEVRLARAPSSPVAEPQPARVAPSPTRVKLVQRKPRRGQSRDVRASTDALVADLVAIVVEDTLESVRVALGGLATAYLPAVPTARASRVSGAAVTEARPADPGNEVVREFDSYGLANVGVIDGRVIDVIDGLRSTAGLTASEGALLLLTIQGVSRDGMSHVRERSRETLRMQIRGLLKKLGEAHLDDAALRILRAALAADGLPKAGVSQVVATARLTGPQPPRVRKGELRPMTEALVADLVALVLGETFATASAALGDVKTRLAPAATSRLRVRDPALASGNSSEVFREFNTYGFKLDAGVDDRVVAVIAELESMRALTSSECALLLLGIHGASRAVMCRVRGTSRDTLKTQVRRLLQKVGAKRLDDIALEILRAALAAGHASPHTSARPAPSSRSR